MLALHVRQHALLVRAAAWQAGDRGERARPLQQVDVGRPKADAWRGRDDRVVDVPVELVRCRLVEAPLGRHPQAHELLEEVGIGHVAFRAALTLGRDVDDLVQCLGEEVVVQGPVAERAVLPAVDELHDQVDAAVARLVLSVLGELLPVENNCIAQPVPLLLGDRVLVVARRPRRLLLTVVVRVRPGRGPVLVVVAGRRRRDRLLGRVLLLARGQVLLLLGSRCDRLLVTHLGGLGRARLGLAAVQQRGRLRRRPVVEGAEVDRRDSCGAAVRSGLLGEERVLRLDHHVVGGGRAVRGREGVHLESVSRARALAGSVASGRVGGVAVADGGRRQAATPIVALASQMRRAASPIGILSFRRTLAHRQRAGTHVRRPAAPQQAARRDGGPSEAPTACAGHRHLTQRSGELLVGSR